MQEIVVKSVIFAVGMCTSSVVSELIENHLPEPKNNVEKVVRVVGIMGISGYASGLVMNALKASIVQNAVKAAQAAL